MTIDVNEILGELIDDKTPIDINPNDVLEELIGDEDLEDEIVEEEFEEEEFEELEVEEEGDSIFEPVKPTEDEKKEYAWAEMRKDNKTKQAELDRLNEVAISYGFKNHSEMLDKLEEERLYKEAKTQGKDPEVFKQINKMEKEINTLKAEKQAEVEKAKALKFLEQVNAFSTKYELTDSEREGLITKLDEDGFTVNELVKIRNTELLFEGYIKETLEEKKKQLELATAEKRRALEEDKFRGAGVEEEVSLDELINRAVQGAHKSKY